MATLVPQRVKISPPATITYVAATTGDKVAGPGSSTVLHVKNGSVSSITVTIVPPNLAFNGAALPSTVVAVPATSEKFIPITGDYTVLADGLSPAITYSATATVTVAALDLT